MPWFIAITKESNQVYGATLLSTLFDPYILVLRRNNILSGVCLRIYRMQERWAPFFQVALLSKVHKINFRLWTINPINLKFST